MTDGFHPPHLDAPVDLAAHLRLLPRDATAKGLFLLEPMRQLREKGRDDVVKSLGLEGKRILPFFDYPYADLLRLLHGAATAVHPDQPVGEGLRRLGRAAYDRFLESRVGSVLFGAFGGRFGMVIRQGPKGWQVAQSFGKTVVEDLAERHVRLHFDEMPCFLETAQIGVIEGAMRACRTNGQLLVRIESLSKGAIDITWT